MSNSKFGEIWMPAFGLRFVERDGKKILQQRWQKQRWYAAIGWAPLEDYEWRDIPLEEEKTSALEDAWDQAIK